MKNERKTSESDFGRWSANESESGNGNEERGSESEGGEEPSGVPRWSPNQKLRFMRKLTSVSASGRDLEVVIDTGECAQLPSSGCVN